ncbi:hypothetical protein ABBQ38_008513 [Trebouxia sp. C0009 RCD-2024]
MKQPLNSGLAADHCMPAAGSSILQRPHLELAMEAQAGLSSGLSLVQEAVDEWFTGLQGFPAPPLLSEQATQRGQRLSKKAI